MFFCVVLAWGGCVAWARPLQVQLSYPVQSCDIQMVATENDIISFWWQPEEESCPCSPLSCKSYGWLSRAPRAAQDRTSRHSLSVVLKDFTKISEKVEIISLYELSVTPKSSFWPSYHHSKVQWKTQDTKQDLQVNQDDFPCSTWWFNPKILSVLLSIHMSWILRLFWTEWNIDSEGNVYLRLNSLVFLSSVWSLRESQLGDSSFSW